MKIASTLAFLLAALACVPAHAQTTIAQLGWMKGTWAERSPGGTTEESWIGPQGNTMAGTSLSPSSFEFMRIVETAQGLSFWSSPNGRPPVEFRLKESGEQRVVFEDPQREFPQRIHYWREGPVLKARIEGTKQGKPLAFEWTYESVVAPQ